MMLPLMHKLWSQELPQIFMHITGLQCSPTLYEAQYDISDCFDDSPLEPCGLFNRALPVNSGQPSLACSLLSEAG